VKQKAVFIRNKSWLKYESCINIIVFSREKNNIFIWIRREICTGQATFTCEKNYKQICWWWIFVDSSDVLIRCLSSCSDGTHSLQRIHWWANYIILNLSKSVAVKKQPHLHLRWTERNLSKLSANFHFWVNYSFNYVLDIHTEKYYYYYSFILLACCFS